MKILKFRDYLVPLVLSGKKNSTWRLSDDKDLSEGDQIILQEFKKNEPFARAHITRVIEKPLGQLTEADKVGHEAFECDEDMYETYSEYYGTKVNSMTNVKIIWFHLIK